MQKSISDSEVTKDEGDDCHISTATCETRLVFLSSLTVSAGGLLFGYDIGIISGAMLQIRREFGVSCLQRELLVSMLFVGAFVASFFGGSIVDNCGRKTGVFLSSLLFLGGALVLAFSNSVTMLLIGRFVVGIGVSIALTSDCAYIAEISPANIRGKLVSLNEFAVTVGFLSAYLLNYAFINLPNGWRFMFGFSAFPSLLLLVAFAFLPQSPYYLLMKGKHDEAKKVLARIQPSCSCDVIIQQMLSCMKDEESTSLWKLLMKEANMRRRMMIGLVLVILQQFSGNANILFYAPTIFAEMGFCSNATSTLASVGLGIIKVVASIFSIFLMDRVGRRRLLLVGATTMAFSLFVLSAEILWTASENVRYNSCREDFNQSYDNETLVCFNSTTGNTRVTMIISVISLLVFVASYQFGFGSGTWMVLSEIFPTAVRGRCISVATGVNWLGNVIVSMTFLQMFYVFGVGQTFLMYAAVCVVAAIFVFFCIPETKGKTLEQISKELRKRSRVDTTLCRRSCFKSNHQAKYKLSNHETDISIGVTRLADISPIR